MSYLSAHVLDAAAGRPAAGIAVRLEDAQGTELATGRTNGDGRVGDLGPDHLPTGSYRVVFATGDYFTSQGGECFYPEVPVHFTTREEESHYHIPLLLSPYSYTTYRGS